MPFLARKPELYLTVLWQQCCAELEDVRAGIRLLGRFGFVLEVWGIAGRLAMGWDGMEMETHVHSFPRDP